MTFKRFRLDEIKVSPNRPKPDPAIVASIAESLQELGLLQPILVTTRCDLLAGYHRLEAAKVLGWESIAANVVDLDVLRAEMVEIDENLKRREISALERAEMLAIRKKLYEALYPDSKRGPGQPSEEDKSIRKHVSYLEDVAAKTDTSTRSVAQNLEPAERLSEEIRDEIRDTPIAQSNRQLRDLASEEPRRQQAIARRVASGKASSVSEAREQIERPKKKPAKKSPPAASDGPFSDGLGNEVPPHLAPDFRAITTAIKDVDRHLLAAQRAWTEVEKLHADTKSIAVTHFLREGSNLLYRDVGLSAKSVSYRLRALAPFAVCIHCHGKACRRCHESGLLPRQQKDAVEREVKAVGS